jgi:ABC-type multidrug transport system permease subunit
MLFSGMNTVAEAGRTDTWRKRYEASHYRQEFVATRSGKQPAAADKTGEEKPRRQFSLTQWLALVKRNVIVKLQDRAQTAILLIQAPLFAVLVALVDYPLRANHFDELSQKLPTIHFLMVVAAIWFGCNNAARDIVGEWTIYKRERMVTLKIFPYVFSKLAVLMALCIFQCCSMLAIVYLSCGLHSNFLSDFLVLLLSSMIGAGLGLCISALSKTNESAIALLPVVLLPIIALGGGMRPIYLMPKAGQIISMGIPSRWSFEANLLEEARAKEWGPKQTLPDLTCTAVVDDQRDALRKQKSGAPGKANPEPSIQGDTAETSIPEYVLTFNDPSGTEQTCRAYADQGYPLANPTAHAVSNRYKIRDSVTVLAGMFVFLVVSVIVILRKRDSDPQ